MINAQPLDKQQSQRQTFAALLPSAQLRITHS
jgi:hypothetical protein